MSALVNIMAETPEDQQGMVNLFTMVPIVPNVDRQEENALCPTKC
jgi:hypothetical protein